jgi:hypothetical protein
LNEAALVGVADVAGAQPVILGERLAGYNVALPVARGDGHPTHLHFTVVAWR